MSENEKSARLDTSALELALVAERPKNMNFSPNLLLRTEREIGTAVAVQCKVGGKEDLNNASADISVRAIGAEGFGSLLAAHKGGTSNAL